MNKYVILGVRKELDGNGVMQHIATVRMFLGLAEDKLIREEPGRDAVDVAKLAVEIAATIPVTDFDKTADFIDEDFLVPEIPVILDPIDHALRVDIETRMTKLSG